MWNDWDGTGEMAEPPRVPERRDRLVLSWKRLNVTVKQTVQKFFGPSKTTYTQILRNGKCLTDPTAWFS